jgi:hypothetical protein
VGGGRSPPGAGREKGGGAAGGIFGGWTIGVGAELEAPGNGFDAAGGVAGFGLAGSKNSRGPTTVTSSSTKLGLSASAPASCSSTTVGC